MSEQWTVQSGDLRAVRRLAGECCELGRDPYLWTLHLSDGLRRLIGGQLVTVGMGDGSLRDLRFDRLRGYVDSGWCDQGQRARGHRFWQSGAVRTDPTFLPFARMRGPLLVQRREDLVTPPLWRRSMHFNEHYSPIGVDHILSCVIQAPPQSGLGFQFVNTFRPVRAAPFSERDRRVALTLFGLVRPLLGIQLAPFGSSKPKWLSPRQRQILALLLRGFAEKQVAGSLGLSPHTVHDHVKALHSRFQVGCRSELLRFARLSLMPGPRPIPPNLSPRMAAVLRFIQSGYMEEEIASELRLCPDTVHDHVKRLHRRFGAHSRPELLFRCDMEAAANASLPVAAEPL